MSWAWTFGLTLILNIGEAVAKNTATMENTLREMKSMFLQQKRGGFNNYCHRHEIPKGKCNRIDFQGRKLENGGRGRIMCYIDYPMVGFICYSKGTEG